MSESSDRSTQQPAQSRHQQHCLTSPTVGGRIVEGSLVGGAVMTNQCSSSLSSPSSAGGLLERHESTQLDFHKQKKEDAIQVSPTSCGSGDNEALIDSELQGNSVDAQSMKQPLDFEEMYQSIYAQNVDYGASNVGSFPDFDYDIGIGRGDFAAGSGGGVGMMGSFNGFFSGF